LNYTGRTDLDRAPPNHQRWITWSILAAILLFGMIFRISYLEEIAGSPEFSYPSLDAGYHDYWARALATGDWTVKENEWLDNFSDPEIPTNPYFRPPGYPWFLSLVYYLTGNSPLAVRIVQMMLGLTNCLLAFLLAKKVYGSSEGLILAALMASYWGFVYFEGELLAPVLTITLLLSLVYTLCLWYDGRSFRHAFAAGVLLGLTSLVRPNVLLFGPVILVWIWWVSRRSGARDYTVKSWIGFTLAAMLVIAPVTIRNYVVARDFVLITSNAGINLYIANNEGSDGFTPSARALQEFTGTGGWRSSDYPRVVRSLEARLGRRMKHSEVSSYFTALAVDYVRQHPWDTLRLIARKAALFWGPAEISNNREINYVKENSSVLRYFPGFPLVVSLFVVGLAWFFASGRSRAGDKRITNSLTDREFEISILILVLIIVYFVSFLPFFAAGRFRAPLIPFIFLFGSYGLHRSGQLATSRSLSRIALLSGAYLVIYIAARLPVVPYTPDAARWHFNRGVARNLAGQLEESSVEYRQAIALDPDFEQCHLNLADLLVKGEEFDKAIEQYLDALRIKPGQANVHNNLGNAYQITGNFEESISHYRKALEITPDNAFTYFNLGVSYQSQDMPDEAIVSYEKAIQLQPDDPNAHYSLANVLRLLGRREEAIPHFREVTRLAPTFVEAQTGLAMLLAQRGDHEEAIDHFERALALRPDDLPALNGLAWVLMDTGNKQLSDPERAVTLARKACELTGNKHPAVLNTMAAAYASVGKFDMAIETAQRAIDLATFARSDQLAESIRERLELYRHGESN